MTARGHEGPRERVTLEEEETVVRGRPSTVTYRVQLNDGWVRARSHPTARVEPLDRAPGVVYRLRIELELEQGTLVERVEVGRAAKPKSTVAHLLSSGSGGAVVRRRFAVAAGGALRPETTK